MRICHARVVAATGAVVLGAATACNLVGPAEYSPRDPYAAYDDDDPPHPSVMPSAVQPPVPPPTPVATVSEAQWNERFERAQRAKHERALELNDAVDRCYQKLRDPETGGSVKLAQAICLGGHTPKPVSSGGGSSPSARSVPTPGDAAVE